MITIAALAALAACAGSEGTGPSGVARADLLALPRTDSAPPPIATLSVRNDQIQSFDVRHSDSTLTLFAEFTFTPRSIVRAGGVLVCDTCTVVVTITPTPGFYGFTIGPSTLVFRSSNTPTVRFTWGTYGDPSVWSTSPRYASEAAYRLALAVWYEASPGLWHETRSNTQPTATSNLAGLEQPGSHVLAALR